MATTRSKTKGTGLDKVVKEEDESKIDKKKEKQSELFIDLVQQGRQEVKRAGKKVTKANDSQKD